RPLRLGFVVNDVATEQENYTTIRLARTAVRLGHEVALIGLDAFIYDANGAVCAHATLPSRRDYGSDADLLAELHGQDATAGRINVEELDVLLLRSDPAEEQVDRPRAPISALLFAQLVTRRAVIVCNVPYHLTNTSNMTNFQDCPVAELPLPYITHDPAELRADSSAQSYHSANKPQEGSGGQSVFVIFDGVTANTNPT